MSEVLFKDGATTYSLNLSGSTLYVNNDGANLNVIISGASASLLYLDSGNSSATIAQAIRIDSGGIHPILSGTEYAGGVFVPLAAALTCSLFDGDAFSTTAKTKIDTSACFTGCPANIKALYARTFCRDSASSSTAACWLLLDSTNTAGVGSLACYCSGIGNDYYSNTSGIVKCDANGDIYFQVAASGASTFDVNIQIWGYWI
jgi:hypothetical protein